MEKCIRMENNSLDITEVDSVVKAVIQKFLTRAHIGNKKYGTDLDRNDLCVSDWISHAQD